MPKRIAVVVSQGQSNNPRKRDLEEEIVTRLMFEPGVDVTVIPHLYDLKADGTGMLALQGVKGDLVVLSWLFSRAAHWTLDRNDIRGLTGPVLLAPPDEAEEEDDDDEVLADEAEEESPRVNDFRDLPQRKIYCVNLRASENPDDFVAEVKRIAAEANTQVVSLGGLAPAAPPAAGGNGSARHGNGSAEDRAAAGNGSSNGASQPVSAESSSDRGSAAPDAGAPDANVSGNGAAGNGDEESNVVRIAEPPGRRWYPVIDYSRCTNCMECIDFCLFGVYGVDAAETILVELPDNCRKGCPACSRVCPENAIIFPQHKSPAIAGAPATDGGLKIDLSLLFGGSGDPLETAARERDEQLLLAGRDAVGTSVGMPKRQADTGSEPKDELDDLIDELDDLDL